MPTEQQEEKVEFNNNFSLYARPSDPLDIENKNELTMSFE